MSNYIITSIENLLPTIKTESSSFSSGAGWHSTPSSGDHLEFSRSHNTIIANFDSSENCPWETNSIRLTRLYSYVGEWQIKSKFLYSNPGALGNWFSGIYVCTDSSNTQDLKYSLKVGILHSDDPEHTQFVVARYLSGPSQVIVANIDVPATPFLVRMYLKHSTQELGMPHVNIGNPCFFVDYSLDDGSTWTSLVSDYNSSVLGQSTMYWTGYFMEGSPIGQPNLAFSDWEIKYSWLHDYDSMSGNGFEAFVLPDLTTNPNYGTETVGFNWPDENIWAYRNPPAGLYLYPGKYADFMDNDTKGIRVSMIRPTAFTIPAGTKAHWGIFWNAQGAINTSPTDYYSAYIEIVDSDAFLYVDRMVGGSLTNLYTINVTHLRKSDGTPYHYDPTLQHTIEVGYDVDETTISVTIDTITAIILRDTNLTSGRGGIYLMAEADWPNDYFVFTEFSRLSLIGSKSMAGTIFKHRSCVVHDTNQLLLEFKDDLATRLNAIQALVDSKQTLFNDFLAKQAEVNDVFDQLLNLSPDTEYKNRSKYQNGMGLFDSDKMDDRDYIEERLSRYDINVVGGKVMIPGGDLDLSALRVLSKILGNCEFSLAEDFIFVTTYDKVISETDINSCGTEKKVTSVVETKIGMDITFAQASDIVSTPEANLFGKVFWCGEIKATPTNVNRLRRLGLTSEEIASVIAGNSVGRITTYLISNNQAIDMLTGMGLSTTEVCTLLTDRTGPDAIATKPSPTEVVNIIKKVMSSSAKPTTDGKVNYSEPPATLLNNVIDLGRSFDLNLNNVSTAGKNDDYCQFLLDALQAAYDAVAKAFLIVQDVLSKLSQNASVGIGTGKDLLGDGIDCILSINVGASVSVNLLGLLGPLLKSLLQYLSQIINAIIAILTLIQELLCIPEAIIQALTGGICGLRIIPWDLCSDEIKEALNMVRAILDAIKAFIAYLLSNLMNSNLDLSISIWMQVQLTLQLGCMGSVSALLGGNVGAGVPAL